MEFEGKIGYVAKQKCLDYFMRGINRRFRFMDGYYWEPRVYAGKSSIGFNEVGHYGGGVISWNSSWAFGWQNNRPKEEKDGYDLCGPRENG